MFLLAQQRQRDTLLFELLRVWLAIGYVSSCSAERELDTLLCELIRLWLLIRYVSSTSADREGYATV